MVSGTTIVNSSAPPGMFQSVAVTAAPTATANSDQLGTTSAQSRVIPPSLFLGSDDDDDDGSYYQNDLPHVPSEGIKTPSPLPVPTMEPSSDDNISDGADVAGANVSYSSDNAPLDDEVALPENADMPQDPNVSLNISLGPAAAMASDGLSRHLSPSLEVCFNVQVGALATYLPPGLIVDGIREGPYITGDMHSIIPADDYQAQAIAYGVLQVHADDAWVLTESELDDLRFFNTRSILIFHAWDTFHACTSLDDIKGVLEQMSRIDLSFLLVLHAAYANYDVNFTVTFGQAKQSFYSFAHQCKFEQGCFDTHPENTPVSSVRAEYFLARTMPQMLSYLSWHGVTVAELPFDINEERWNLLGAIPDEVHARFELQSRQLSIHSVFRC